MATAENMTVADLVSVLQCKPQADIVEYVICKTDGQLVAVNVKDQAEPLRRLLQLFGGGNG